jgi:hypothetical protein
MLAPVQQFPVAVAWLEIKGMAVKAEVTLEFF